MEFRVGRETDSEDETISFVRMAINSVCALELLVLLRGERPGCRTAHELVRELRSSEIAVAQALDNLMRTGLVEEIAGEGYRYQQRSALLDAVSERLELLYRQKPVRVIRAILDAPNEKLRILADAFRLSEKGK